MDGRILVSGSVYRLFSSARHARTFYYFGRSGNDGFYFTFHVSISFIVFFRLRDKGDELAKIIHIYADSETVNRSLSTGLTNFSATLSVISDYR